jgi:hypothetical protein
MAVGHQVCYGLMDAALVVDADRRTPFCRADKDNGMTVIYKALDVA